jgi:endonuclease IV
VGEIRFGPARVPSQESPESAVEVLQARGYRACEIDFEQKFWMDYDWAARLGELCRDADIVLSVHAPIAGFMGHAERGKKLNMAVGMLDHSAGIAKAAGAEVVVFHPGFLLGRTRDAAIDSVVQQLGELRQRLEKKDRAVPFGVEVMGRVREPGVPFHIHFSDIQYANRNETKHLPYGEGTLRADPLREALARFERPATVIGESPDEESNQLVKTALGL